MSERPYEGRSVREVLRTTVTAIVGETVKSTAYKHGKTRRYDKVSISDISGSFKLIL